MYGDLSVNSVFRKAVKDGSFVRVLEKAKHTQLCKVTSFAPVKTILLLKEGDCCMFSLYPAVCGGVCGVAFPLSTCVVRRGSPPSTGSAGT